MVTPAQARVRGPQRADGEVARGAAPPVTDWRWPKVTSLPPLAADSHTREWSSVGHHNHPRLAAGPASQPAAVAHHNGPFVSREVAPDNPAVPDTRRSSWGLFVWRVAGLPREVAPLLAGPLPG